MSKTVQFEVSDEEEAAVAKVVDPYRTQVNDTPALLSLLYDIDLLPEQIPHFANAKRMVAVCEMFKRLTPEAINEMMTGGDR